MSNKNSNPFKNDELEVKDEEKQETVDEAETNSETENNTDEEVNADENTDNNEALTVLQTKYDTLNQQYVRLAADFDNYRKRQEQERENLVNLGKETILKKMLEVLDNFDRGEKSLENVDDCEKVKESFTLVHRQVCESLTKLGLEEIKAIGEEFDPNFHEAVMQTPSSEHKEHTVIAELQKGYKYGDKVLRATLVNVATAQ